MYLRQYPAFDDYETMSMSHQFLAATKTNLREVG